MIPLLQQILGGPGLAPVAAESVVEGDGFAVLMDQPTLAPTDGAVILAMMSVAPMLPLPLPTVQTGSCAAPRDDVTISPPILPTADPVASGGFDLAAVPSLPVSDAPDALQPALPLTDGPAPAPPTVEAVQPEKRIAPTLPEPEEQASALPKPQPATLREVAFMARIEPQVQVAAPPPAPDANIGAVVAVMPANPAPRPIRQPLPLQTSVDLPVNDQPPAPETVTPQVAPMILVPDKDVPIVVAPMGDPAPLMAADAQSVPDPQVTQLSTPDRPSQTPPALAAPLPPTVPMALMVHAPQAALGPVEVVLNPEELGKLRFEIHQQGDQVRVVLTVERPETLDLLRRHADQLVQEFRAAGYSGASLSFGNWGGQQGGTSGQTAQSEPDFVVADTPHLPPPHPRNFAPSTGLNLRL